MEFDLYSVFSDTYVCTHKVSTMLFRGMVFQNNVLYYKYTSIMFMYETFLVVKLIHYKNRKMVAKCTTFLKWTKILLIKPKVYLNKDYYREFLLGCILHLSLLSLKNGVNVKKCLAFFQIKKKNTLMQRTLLTPIY